MVIYENWVFDVFENWHGYHPKNHPDTRFRAVSNNCPTLALTTTDSLYGNILERQFWKNFFCLLRQEKFPLHSRLFLTGEILPKREIKNSKISVLDVFSCQKQCFSVRIIAKMKKLKAIFCCIMPFSLKTIVKFLKEN